MTTRTLGTVPGIALGAVALLAFALTGCTASPVSDPAVTDPAPPADSATDDCVVGTWNLNVPAYAADSEAFLLSTGLPLEAFAMDGAGKVTFTDDGLVAAEIALTTDVTVGGMPLSVPSDYTASADWSRTGDGTLQFDNWARVTDEPDIPPEVEVPELDVTQLADVTVECSSGALFLQGADAPFGAAWTR